MVSLRAINAFNYGMPPAPERATRDAAAPKPAETEEKIRAKVACDKAGDRARGAVLAGDAFFPFADGLQVCAAAGVTAAIQPGGSKRDDEVIAAADAASMAMLFTGVRHFRH